jgi:membrane protein YdbS with pleckstrin-like domain
MSFLRNRNLIWFISLLTLVFGSNVLLYRLELMQPLPDNIALATLLDFMIIIPLITYFFIIRKRYSLKYLILVGFAGYGAAMLIIPQGYLGSYSFVRYILLAGEGAFFLVELYIVFKLVTKLPAIFKYYKQKQSDIPAFPHRMEQALTHYLKQNRFIEIVSSEMSMFYYSFFSWRKKQIFHDNEFTFHKKTSAVALNLMLIHALVLESVGLHFFLHNWSPTIAFIALILNGYTVTLFLAEIQAIRLVPFMITDQSLYLQVGIMKRLTVPLKEIKSVRYYQGPEKVSKEVSKQVFDAVLADFVKEKPAIEIEFYSPQEVKKMYGLKQRVLFVHLSPDEPQKFLETLNAKRNSFF